MAEKAYKLFRTDEGELKSAIVVDAPDDIIVTYHKGEKVEPNLAGTKLFVFKELKDAVRFASFTSSDIDFKLFPNYSIWHVECDVLEFVEMIAPISMGVGTTGKNIRTFWDRFKTNPTFWFDEPEKFSYHIVKEPPRGTYSCNWLIPIEQVDLENEEW